MKTPIEATADRQSVDNILADLNNLRARRVVAAGSGAEFGFDDPWVRVALRLRPEKRAATTQPAGEAEPVSDDAGEVSAETQPSSDATPAATTQPAGAEEEPAAAPKTGADDAQPEPSPSPGPETYVLLAAATPEGKVYARLEDGQLIYEIDHLVLDNLLAELHDRKAMPIDRQTFPTRITWRSPDRAITLKKAGRDKWIADADPVLPIDARKVEDAFHALCDLRTGRFVTFHADNLAEYGLDKPAFEVTVLDEFGETATMLVSASGPEQDPQQSRYAMVAGTGKVYLLPLDGLSAVHKTLTDFEKTE